MTYNLTSSLYILLFNFHFINYIKILDSLFMSYLYDTCLFFKLFVSEVLCFLTLTLLTYRKFHFLPPMYLVLRIYSNCWYEGLHNRFPWLLFILYCNYTTLLYKPSFWSITSFRYSIIPFFAYWVFVFWRPARPSCITQM